MIDDITTPVEQWQGSRFAGQLILLPSGNRARVRRTLSLMQAMKNGTLPNPLAKQIERLLGLGLGGAASGSEADQETERKAAEEAFKSLETEALNQMLQLIDDEVCYIFVSPKVLPVPEGEDPSLWKPTGDNEISIQDVTWEDRVYAYNFAQGAALDLGRFRATQQTVAAMANEQALSRPAQHAAASG